MSQFSTTTYGSPRGRRRSHPTLSTDAAFASLPQSPTVGASREPTKVRPSGSSSTWATDQRRHRRRSVADSRLASLFVSLLAFDYQVSAGRQAAGISTRRCLMLLERVDPFVAEFDRLTQRAFGGVDGAGMPMDVIRRADE